MIFFFHFLIFFEQILFMVIFPKIDLNANVPRNNLRKCWHFVVVVLLVLNDDELPSVDGLDGESDSQQWETENESSPVADCIPALPQINYPTAKETRFLTKRSKFGYPRGGINITMKVSQFIIIKLISFFFARRYGFRRYEFRLRQFTESNEAKNWTNSLLVDDDTSSGCIKFWKTKRSCIE